MGLTFTFVCGGTQPDGLPEANHIQSGCLVQVGACCARRSGVLSRQWLQHTEGGGPSLQPPKSCWGKPSRRLARTPLRCEANVLEEVKKPKYAVNPIKYLENGDEEHYERGRGRGAVVLK